MVNFSQHFTNNDHNTKTNFRLSEEHELRIRGMWSMIKFGGDPYQCKAIVNVCLPIRDRNAVWRSKVKSIFSFAVSEHIFCFFQQLHFCNIFIHSIQYGDSTFTQMVSEGKSNIFIWHVIRRQGCKMFVKCCIVHSNQSI